MSTHNIGLYEDLAKIIFELSSNTHLISSAVFQKETPSDQQLHLAALQGNLEQLKKVIDSGKVHVDCKDKVNRDLSHLTHSDFLAHRIEKSDVLPWIRNLLSYPSDITQGPLLVT